MSDKRLTDLSELTTVADDDLIYVVDVSDTTHSAAGSSRYAQAKNARGYPQTSAESSAGVTPTNYEYEPGNVLRYGTNTTPGTTDMTTAISNALSIGIPVYIPEGNYLVSSTLSLGTTPVLYGDGYGSQIKSSITDGTATIKLDNLDKFELRDFAVYGSTGSTTDPSTVNNAIGIEAVNSCNRGHFANIDIWGFAKGAKLDGFINRYDNFWIRGCTLGLQGTTMNNCIINLFTEACAQAFTLSGSSAIVFESFLDEGDDSTTTSTVDNCDGVTFIGPYFEETLRTVPFITFGATTQCKGVRIIGCNVGMADNASASYNMYPLAFDQVDGLYIDGFFSTGSRHNAYSTTANTKNILDLATHSADNVFAPHDASKNSSRALNYFPNPNFDMWLRGYPVMTTQNGALAKETTLVRKGLNAAKLTMNAAATSTYTSFIFNDGYLASKLVGKNVSLYMWVWIPNTSDFDPDDTTSQTVQPYIAVYHDGTGAGNTQSGTHHTVRGAWNLFKVKASIPSDATRIDITLFMSCSGGAAGTEYVVIDSIYLLEGDFGQDIHVRNGWVVDSDCNPTKAVGGKMIMSGAAAPTDADFTHEVGDIVYNNSPTAGGTIGWVCTTAGSPGTWKTFGAITA